MSNASKRFYLPEEYLALEADSDVRHEYYKGAILPREAGSRAHNQIARNIFGNLYAQLDRRHCIPHNSMTRLRVQATGLYTYPDVAVACKPLDYDAGGSETLLNPRVLVEVLSPSTEDHDLGFKLKHYRQLPSLQEALFFSQDEPRVEHYTRQAGDSWLVRTIMGLEAVVELASIGCALPMQVIYADVEFGGSAESP